MLSPSSCFSAIFVCLFFFGNPENLSFFGKILRIYFFVRDLYETAGVSRGRPF